MANVTLSKRRSSPSEDNYSTTRFSTRKPSNAEFNRENLRINIIHLYGEEIFQLTRTFEKLRVKKARSLCSLTFLRRCRDEKIIPVCMSLSHHTKTPSTKRILRGASLALLRDAIHRTRSQLDRISQDLLRIHIELSNKLHLSLWQSIDHLAHLRADTETTLSTEQQKKKFDKLKYNQRPREEASRSSRMQQPKLVYNLSDETLDENTTTVLTRGFNFAVAPSNIPTEEIICSVEAAIYKLDNNTAETIRQDVSRTLRSAKPPKKNISREEHLALKKLRDNEHIIVLPADKGNATVVMNTTEYKSKMSSILEDAAYQPTSTDPTTYLEKTTKAKIEATPLDPATKKLLIPREKSSRCPKLYGLPKIHKPDVPLRPIVSSIGSPVQNLARYLAQQLQPHAEKAASYVKNANHLIELLRNHTVRPNQLLVSFDVVSLFTQVPVNEAIEIIQDKHKPADHILELVRHCLKNTYFMYDNQRYKQVEGAPMGSPLSPVIANLFMEDLETRAIDTAKLKPDLWLRYVDDTLVIWSHGREELDKFLEHLNNLHSTIKFTMEVEENNQLPFLDVLISKREDGSLGHTVYRKNTHTNRYLNAESHHHPAQLYSVVKTLVTRSKTIADEQSREKEMENISEALQQNGYSKREISRASRPSRPKEPEEPDRYISKAILPYVRGTTDRISRILRKHKIDTIFKPHTKIQTLLRNPKTKIPLESQGVYEIPCRDCEKTYIGQTNRRIGVRKEEHIKAVQRKDPSSSLASHVIETGHRVDFDKTRTIASIENFSTRITREAIEIEKHPHNLNTRDDAQRLPKTWKPTLIHHRSKTIPARVLQHEVETINKAPAVHRHGPVNRQGPVTRSQSGRQSCSMNNDQHRVYKQQPETPNVSSSRSLRPRRTT